MTSFYRWQLAVLTLTVGLAAQSASWGEELCAHCAQKGTLGHSQKYGSSKGTYQKGHAQKGKGYTTHTKHHKEHKWFFSEHPPAAPILESAAIRRVPVPQRVNFRIQRESGQLRADPPRQESAAAPDDDINKRLTALEQHVTRLYSSLDKLVDQLQNPNTAD